MFSGLKIEKLNTRNKSRLDELYKSIQEQYQYFVGYPCTGGFDYSELYRFLKYPLNNVGDPFMPGSYRVSTRNIECEVLDWFAALHHLQPDEYWGYVTNGGSEGNMYGLYLARELLPEGVAYYSQDTHYSVSKSLRVLKMQHIMIRSLPNGEIDYEDLRETMQIHRTAPPIIFANIGTTMKEGIDDISRIREILDDLAIPAYYIHCDAALCGMTLPFIDDAPVFDFRAGIDSLAISGHKFIGSPIPCGVVLARKRNVDLVARSIEYVGSLDTTLSGSRNAFTPLIIWYAIKTLGHKGFRMMADHSLEMAGYAIEQLTKKGIESWRNRFAITVVMPRVPESVTRKWQIAVHKDHSHIILMPHITKMQVDELVEDIAESFRGSA